MANGTTCATQLKHEFDVRYALILNDTSRASERALIGSTYDYLKKVLDGVSQIGALDSCANSCG